MLIPGKKKTIYSLNQNTLCANLCSINLALIIEMNKQT